MRKLKIVGLAGIVALVLISVLVWQTATGHGSATHTGTTTISGVAATKATSAQSATHALLVVSKPDVVTIMTATPTATAAGPTATGAPSKTSVPSSTASTPTASGAPSTLPVPISGSSTIRYFPVGTSVDAIKAGASNMTKQQVKTLIEGEVNAAWPFIQSKLGFSSAAKAYAFFLGQASRESTLNAGLETGSGSAHSYGPLQAAETAYANANPSYTPENDVTGMTQYTFTPENFYDPGISVYMGIRHLIHFANQASAAGYTGPELLRHALMGFNTGYINTSNASWMVQYSDEIGSIAGWYLNNGHLYDSAFTWTGSPDVNRSSPWGWY